MKTKIKILEVGARDGLQNEATSLSVGDRAEFLSKLMATGLKFLEGGSLVSPTAIPQMIDSEKVWDLVSADAVCRGVDLSFLVANRRGFERAEQAHMNSIAVFTATSETFAKKNIGKSVQESLTEFSQIVSDAKKLKIRVRGYVSTVFGCPFEGPQDPHRAVALTEELFRMGCDEVSIGDTIGVAHPKQVDAIFKLLVERFGAKALAGHFHDTRGMALTNVRAALEQGVRTFDSSLGGLGGCPYAPGSSGNLATEEVVWLLEGLGYSTGVDLDALFETAAWVESKIGRGLRGKLYLSKPKRFNYF